MNNPIDAINAYVQRDTYGFASTRSILNTFEQHGWVPVSQQTASVRNEAKQGYQKHLIRLEHQGHQQIDGLDVRHNSRPQLIIVNSHDGSSSLQILWGVLRIACLNGIIAGTGLNGVRLIHSASIINKLPDAIQYMLNNLPVFREQLLMLQGKQLSVGAQRVLVETLYNARLQNVQNVIDIDYSLPAVRRLADGDTDAFTVYNRIQEVLMRGGIKYTREALGNNGGFTHLVPCVTRKVSSVNSQVKLNQLAYDTVLKLAA